MQLFEDLYVTPELMFGFAEIQEKEKSTERKRTGCQEIEIATSSETKRSEILQLLSCGEMPAGCFLLSLPFLSMI